MNADKFLTQRIMLIGNDLNSTENRMASFKQTNDVIDFDKNASTYLDQSNQANQQVMKLESEKNVGLFPARLSSPAKRRQLRSNSFYRRH